MPELIRRLALLLSGLAGLALLPLVGYTIADVARRQITGQPIQGAVETTEVGIVIIVFLGMMGAQVNGRHISTPILTNRLPSVVAHIVRFLALTVSVLLLCWMASETWVKAMDSLASGEYRYGMIHVPLWPARLAIPIGLGSLALALALSALQILGQLVRGEQAEQTDYEANL